MDPLSLPLFTAQQCDALVAELRNAAGAAATVYGRAADGAVDSSARRATRLLPPAKTHESVLAAFNAIRERLADHFKVALTSCEEPQFLRYQIGDYFVAHQDGNTPVIHDDSRHRRVSVIVFLSAPQIDYEGGDLVFIGDYRDGYARHTIPCPRGTLLAFRSETTHEVTPLTRGERHSIVTWYR